ncbi:hypothetical protein PV11_02551 [Exophiala sideris]|uniref:Uncharacterized protein n=1 Tax=Exophiala sideris TaxID=1016849 RepID=A0A0D1ZJM8_9EURO|nr:hypothetical protein PV11_02551 [Exophiala sideris]
MNPASIIYLVSPMLGAVNRMLEVLCNLSSNYAIHSGTTTAVDQRVHDLCSSLKQLSAVLEPLAGGAKSDGMEEVSTLLQHAPPLVCALQQWLERWHSCDKMLPELRTLLPATKLICESVLRLMPLLSSAELDADGENSKQHGNIVNKTSIKPRSYATEDRTPSCKFCCTINECTCKPCYPFSHKSRSQKRSTTGSKLKLNNEHSKSCTTCMQTEHICWDGPAEVIMSWSSGCASHKLSSAVALTEVAALIRSRRFKQRLEPCMPRNYAESTKEFIDCASWWLDQPSNETEIHVAHQTNMRPLHSDCPTFCEICRTKHAPNGDKRSAAWSIFPEDAIYAHFAKRAAICALSSFMYLTEKELFALSTTKVLYNDIEWPSTGGELDENVRKFMDACNKFLGVDASGHVRFKTQCTVNFFVENPPVTERNAHLYMTLACLTHMRRQPRLILRPWLDFHDNGQKDMDFCVHNYILTYWHLHYREADGYSAFPQRNLHLVVQEAWAAERAAESLLDHREGNKDNGNRIHVEALNFGLEICRAHGVRDLEEIYIRMGADSSGKSRCTHKVAQMHSPDLLSQNSRAGTVGVASGDNEVSTQTQSANFLPQSPSNLNGTLPIRLPAGKALGHENTWSASSQSPPASLCRKRPAPVGCENGREDLLAERLSDWQIVDLPGTENIEGLTDWRWIDPTLGDHVVPGRT